MMPDSIAQVRCFKHVSREAAAKCPACSKFYCRECVTEHEGRVLCVSCLSAQLEPEVKHSSGWFRSMSLSVFSFVAYFFTAYVFYLIGRFLLRIPSDFHSGIFFD